MMGLADSEKKSDDALSSFDKCDRQTDRQADRRVNILRLIVGIR